VIPSADDHRHLLRPGVVAGIVAGVTRASGSMAFASEMLRWVFLIGVGVPDVVAYFGHTFGGEAAARRLG
jgi:hypothetical protein